MICTNFKGSKTAIPFKVYDVNKIDIKYYCHFIGKDILFC